MTKAASLRFGAMGCATVAAAAFVAVAPVEAAPAANLLPVPAAPVLPLPQQFPLEGLFVGFFQIVDNVTDGLPLIGEGSFIGGILDFFAMEPYPD